MTGAHPLDGRVAVVTGANGTIGRRVCAQLVDAGARVVAQCRSSADAVGHLAAEGRLVAVRADFDGPAGVAELSSALEREGGADILVNTVHTATDSARVADLPTDLLRAHLDAVVLHSQLCAAVLPGMRERNWGRIVYVSGALMARPAEGRGAYAAAKSAASTLTRYVAWEEGRSGITANIVAPGRVIDPDDAGPELTPEWSALEDALRERTALGRFPTSVEVASAVLALVGPEAAPITGQTVWVTGGEAIG